MINNKLLQQFRYFYFKNYPDDMENFISYFSVFGGVDLDVDTTLDIKDAIKTIVLENFDKINEKIEYLTLNDNNNKRLLHALAIGDRRIFSAFNKAHLNNINGGIALNYLQEKGLVWVEYSREKHPREKDKKIKLKREEARYRISHKVFFNYPFLRFWFYFIVPNIRYIKEKNFSKVLKDFEQKQNSYTSLIYEELSEILLNYNIRDEKIETSGSYWDAKMEIDILTTTQNGNIYVAECKWTNHKINKKELHKLKDKCEKLGIKPTKIIFFSKRGFSKELLQLENKNLSLYTSDDFQNLVKSTNKLTNNPQSLISLL